MKKMYDFFVESGQSERAEEILNIEIKKGPNAGKKRYAHFAEKSKKKGE